MWRSGTNSRVKNQHIGVIFHTNLPWYHYVIHERMSQILCVQYTTIAAENEPQQSGFGPAGSGRPFLASRRAAFNAILIMMVGLEGGGVPLKPANIDISSEQETEHFDMEGNITMHHSHTFHDQTKYIGFEGLLSAFAQKAPSRTALLYEQHGKKSSLTRQEFVQAVHSRVRELLDRQNSAVRGVMVARESSAESVSETGCRTAAGNSAADSHKVPTCLGVLCDGSLSCVLTIFASALAGFQTVLLDENAAEELLVDQIRQTDIDCLWGSDEELLEELQPCLTAGIPDGCPPLSASGRRILFFTSGTTSSSKAVVLTDESLMAAAYNGSCKLPLSEEDTLLCMLPLNHVFGFVCGLLWGMQCGCTVALGRGARYYTQDLSFYRPTALSAVPMLLGFLLQHDLLNEELKLVLAGAGDCPKALLSAASQKGISVSFGYGLTETSSGVAISVPPAYRREDGAAPSFDPYALEVCPENTVTLADDGEILVTGDSCMMKGYYKHPEATAAVLRDGVLYTGDLGRWDEDGRLHIIGRKKEILVLPDGTKIFLPEYEARIAAALPGADFAVILRDGKPALLLFDPDLPSPAKKTPATDTPGLPSQTEKSPAAEAARATIQSKLKAVMAGLPRGQQLGAILFTDRPLPRTATGKVKRWELQQSPES